MANDGKRLLELLSGGRVTRGRVTTIGEREPLAGDLLHADRRRILRRNGDSKPRQ